MPLASTAKIIIAIEFARQCSSNMILPTSKIAIQDLAKYYIPNTDGGAHVSWLASLGTPSADSVSLLNVAKGMIKYSSNANTEYLLDLLGLANINKNLTRLSLKTHQPLYYFSASALMVCLRPEGVPENNWIKQLTAMSTDEYRKKSEEVHQRLKADPFFIKQFKPANLSIDIQRIWSDRLVASTAADYAQLMQKIVSRKSFTPEVQTILDSIIEWPMEFPAINATFNHLGQKSGSTRFVLTDAFYASPKDSQQLACAFFFNALTESESILINRNFAMFERDILTNPGFRKKLAEELK